MSYLELSSVRKAFGSAVAVENFDLQVEQGEFVSFLGPSGCGKTTTLRMVAGFERPTSGTIVVDNTDITNMPANKRNIGMVFQQYALFPNMTVADNITFGQKIAGESKEKMLKTAADMLDLIALPGYGARYPHQLSGGQQQRVALARALAIHPRVLLLDEPLSALDAKIRVTLRQEIRAIQRRLGITTIYVTHDQEEALSISDRIVVMNHGRIEQIGTPRQIYNTPETQFAASFIGTLNVLKGVVQDGQHLLVDGQSLTTSSAVHEKAGHEVSIAIRPEAIMLTGDTQANQLQAKVEDVYFLGSVVRVRLALNDQHVNMDMFNTPNLRIPSVGEAVTARFGTEAVKLLRATE